MWVLKKFKPEIISEKWAFHTEKLSYYDMGIPFLSNCDKITATSYTTFFNLYVLHLSPTLFTITTFPCIPLSFALIDRPQKC